MVDGNQKVIRLLVVEDNSAFLYLLQQAFADRKEQFLWELTIAEDGQEALDLLFAEEIDSEPLPHLVLLDWNLPKVTGSEVLRRIKDHPKLRRLPVLVFSSSAADRDVHAAYDSHTNGYITKPDSIDALEAIVEALERFWIAIARLPKVVRRP
jgi:two-component system, chemotaxis family, response regulator Rcp1